MTVSRHAAPPGMHGTWDNVHETAPPPLDVAAVLAKLKDGRREHGGVWYSASHVLEAIALLEPHVPPPPDPWQMQFEQMLATYGNTRYARKSGDALFLEILTYVAAERARTRGIP